MKLNTEVIGVKGDHIISLTLRWALLREEALDMAAWIVAVSGENAEDFSKRVEEVLS